MDYNQLLKDKFQDLEINLVKHDTSPTGMPCYIEVKLGYNPKDKGSLVLDLGNYIARPGLRYQMTPEFRGKGKQTTVRWFMTWSDLEPIRANILEAFDKAALIKAEQYLPLEFRSLIIQNTASGVYPQQRSA